VFLCCDNIDIIIPSTDFSSAWVADEALTMRDNLARRWDSLEKILAQTAPNGSRRSTSVDGFHTFVSGLKVSLEFFKAV